MRDDRDRHVQAIRARLARAGASEGVVRADVVFDPEADAELRALLCGADTGADLEARHVAGWLCLARAAASDDARGSVHGGMAGTLLFPVWMADPALVPPQLAAGYEATDPADRPDPAHADGPAEWSVECAAAVIAAEGRQHRPPPDATEDDLRLYDLAVRVGTSTPSREVLLGLAVGMGSLAVLATPEHDPTYATRVADLTYVLSLAGQRVGQIGDGAPTRRCVSPTAPSKAFRPTHPTGCSRSATWASSSWTDTGSRTTRTTCTRRSAWPVTCWPNCPHGARIWPTASAPWAALC
ncbi:hypothetical protein M4V62_07245 [Streptomyces durmitorensis]|uniref:Uncharacterized protein n=1 Tax=Streptomyces durmitorensis TaxID=319947 RepID=A0ABY4PM74_9ACTN|nr:hypothetical protein [Streptomyces durmitorensis]UQT54908.1 hypothetical protein M4V62_07245 [Streptomyces durmitorensis]